jgi:glucose-6-phosphate isomerase
LRKLEDASQVLQYPGDEGPEVLYAMYRGTGLEKDQWALTTAGLRYDVTVIFPGTIGSEYVKTVGHYHPRVPGNPGLTPRFTRSSAAQRISCSKEAVRSPVK